MQDVIRTNGATGFHFFAKGTMQFFNSRVCSDTLTEGPGGVFFVTSERFSPSEGESYPRLYTIRRFYPDTGNVLTVGGFQEYASRESAASAAKAMAQGGAK